MTDNDNAATRPVTLLVLAKAPIPGFAKTRLCPPLSSAQAARLAGAALLDTLDAALDCPVAHRVVALTGELGTDTYHREIAQRLAGMNVIRQRGNDFAVRLANTHTDAARAGLPVFQIGMDTPQLRSTTLTDAADALVAGSTAILGPATDGGWWGLGLPTPRLAHALTTVPMSTTHTCALTCAALVRRGAEVRMLSRCTDVDHFADAIEVADECAGHFAAEMHNLGIEHTVAQ